MRGQRFPNVASFRDALYLMSLGERFQYYFKRNFYRHMIVVCIVNECPWKITCHAIGTSDVVQVHTFINHHSHSINDVVSNQPLVRSTRAAMVIDDVIQSLELL